MNKTEADLYKYVGKCLEEHNLNYTKVSNDIHKI